MKICLVIGCNRNSFSHGYCQIHQYKRTDRKAMEARNKTVQPRSPIKPYKRTDPDKSGFKTTKSELMTCWGFKNQKEMFDFVWQTREHKCQISGSNLDLVPEDKYHWMFSHILAKKNYPFFKLNPENILLVSPDVHYCVDNFTTDMIFKHKDYDFGKWMNLVLEQKQKYKDFLKDNQL